MSPRMPAVLRDSSGQNVRDHLIATAARLIDQRGSADLAVRDIAREAKVADGVLYNYFEDKEDLLAHALLAHVGNVMTSTPRLLPSPGEGTLAENLQLFIEGGIATLLRVTPAFAGLLSQPKVLNRFHTMVGGDPSFDPSAGEGMGHAGAREEAAGGSGEAAGGSGEAAGGSGEAAGGSGEAAGGIGEPAAGGEGGRGLPDMLTAYLRAEQRLGRVDAAADIVAAASLIVGAIHGQILPRVLFNPPGTPITTSPELAARLAETVLHGIAPGAQNGLHGRPVRA
jgi:AcrR family transcriptional regulator